MSKIHIALLGKEVLPVFYPIRKYMPDKVYIIGTRQNKDTAERLKGILAPYVEECCTKTTEPYDVEAVMSCCNDIHAAATDSDEYTYNVTGGTKPMAIGALLAAQKHGAKIVYTDAQSCIDLTTFKSEPLDCQVDSKTIFALQGQVLKDFVVYTPDVQKIGCAEEIQNFISWHIREYSSLMREYIKSKYIPSVFYTDRVDYRRENGRIIIESDDVEILNITHPESFRLLFEGRWWEELVAKAIYDWADGRFEIWQSVTFKPVKSTALKSKIDKNEVDILVNTGNTLVFIECKSGTITQDNIYKMDTIRKTYGSDKSRSVLVSFRNETLKPELLEKAQESGIEIIAPTKRNSALQRIPTELDRILKSIFIK